MSCVHCGTADQRGRFCVGCGKLLPPSTQPPRRVRLAPPAIDETQPVLRLRVTPRRPVEEEPAAV
jgi:methionyl-tRNA synthetase